MSGIDWTKAEQDSRPKRHAWAPGDYLCTCATCEKGFIGDKRALTCADCAYAEPDAPMTTKTESLVERLKLVAETLAGQSHDTIIEAIARLTAPVGLETSAIALRSRADAITGHLDVPEWRPRRSHIEGARNELRKAASDLDTLSARLREAEEALEPFAEALGEEDETERKRPDRLDIWEMPEAMAIELGHLRRAAAIRSRRDA